MNPTRHVTGIFCVYCDWCDCRAKLQKRPHDRQFYEELKAKHLREAGVRQPAMQPEIWKGMNR